MKKLLQLFLCAILSLGYIVTVQASTIADNEDGRKPIRKSELKTLRTGNQLNAKSETTYDITLKKSSFDIQNHITNGGGDLIISNLDQSQDDSAIGDVEYYLGQSFITDANSYIMESVALSIDEEVGSPLAAILKLYSADVNGEINNLLCEFSSPVKIGNNLYEFIPSVQQTLFSNTIYWLIFYSSSSTSFHYTYSMIKTGPGSFPMTNLWAESADGGVSYFYGDDDPFIFAVYGTKLPVAWTGQEDSDWFKSGNWDSQIVPTMTHDVVIPPGKNNYPTITGGTPEFASLTIQSDATGTGSFIMNNSTEDIIYIERYMSGNAWHLIGSPVSSMSIENLLTNNASIPLKEGSRGMMDYNPASNDWNGFFTNATVGSLAPGKGYAVRTSSDAAITFYGNINTGSQSISGLSPGNWNLTGNPYTSALGITNNAATTQKFIAQNASKLDPSYQALYIWEESTGQYKIVSNVNVPGKSLNQDYVQPTQGFFVKMASGENSISFSSDMQAHVSETTAPFKSAQVPWPYITLKAVSGGMNTTAALVFGEGMTRGLDPSYDIGAFGMGNDLQLTTRLINDNGVQFAIQALPVSVIHDFEIPIDIKTVGGGLTEISAQFNGFSHGLNLILEDRELNITTPLLNPDMAYKVELAGKTNSTGRFYLVSSNSTTGVNDNTVLQNLRAYMHQSQIIIDGKIGRGAYIILHDIHGRLLFSRQLNEGTWNRIDTPPLTPGIYLLRITEQGENVTVKVSATGR